ncbi:MAG: DoxX family protein [Campylobacteraceae bacterium]|nr:DoxX family protein [Campylobacteraceae bacterium]
MSRYLNFPSFGLLLLRVFLGINVLFHGVAKIKSGVGGVAGMLVAKGIPAFIAYGVYIGEIIAPIMIIVGFYTRLASLILIGTCAVILYVGHADTLFAITPYGGLSPEIVYLYLGGALCLFFCGGGKFSAKND